jgi:glutamate-1-semialdehyde 2,1-aminomutase
MTRDTYTGFPMKTFDEMDVQRMSSITRSARNLQKRAHQLIPGGCHTYAKGDDQYPESAPPFICRGLGCHVWDLDGKEYIEYNMGLRAVTLGHAYRPVVDAACAQMQLGANFTRPSPIEVEAAEELLGIIIGAEMVKFAKNGSDATTAAVKLARAFTGRDIVAICADHPFFSVDDWFIGSTVMAAGIPEAIRNLTVKFSYNDIASIQALFERYPGRIACLIMEPETIDPPVNDFLHESQRLCHRNGAVFILDETITGFRWHIGGAQRYYDIVPDLSAFGKAMGNGFSVAALAGKKDIMRLGGLDQGKERVFLLSLTHGAEAHSLAAAVETMRIYRREPVVPHLHQQGQRLIDGILRIINDLGLQEYFQLVGKPCNLVYATRDQEKSRSQPFRTLFLQELLKRGVIAPSLVVSYSHSNRDIDRTVEAVAESLWVYRKALHEGIEKYLVGRSVQPVFRKLN